MTVPARLVQPPGSEHLDGQVLRAAAASHVGDVACSTNGRSAPESHRAQITPAVEGHSLCPRWRSGGDADLGGEVGGVAADGRAAVLRQVEDRRLREQVEPGGVR